MKRILIVPARSGSKRIPNKNKKKLNGQPIISYPLKIAIKSKLFKKIHISTNSEEIINIGKKIGVSTEFKRPKLLCRDNVDLFSVIKFVKKEFQIKYSLVYDEYWCILPCSPLIEVKDLIACSRLLKKNKNCGVMTISSFPKPVNWSLELNKKKFILPNKKIRNLTLSKKKYFYDAGQLYCFSKNFLNQKNFNFKKTLGYKLPFHKSVDVDDMNDWKLMEQLFQLNNKKWKK